MVSTYGRHEHSKSGGGSTCGKSLLQELQNLPTGQLTGSSWRFSHHEVNNPLQGQFSCWGSSGLEYVSTTSVERPEAMSCAPSGATLTVPTTLDGGEIMNPPAEREEILPDGNLPCSVLLQNSRKQSNRKGKAYIRRLGHVCTMASSPNGAGWVRENQNGHCEVSRDTKKSTNM